jgi:hypothetical protein
MVLRQYRQLGRVRVSDGLENKNSGISYTVLDMMLSLAFSS